MTKIIRVKQGLLRGKVEGSQPLGQFISFKGIPYAKPPIGKLRFKAPQPPESWYGILDTTQHGNICPQIDALSGEYVDGNEDCLFLNVYVPHYPSEERDSKLAVMIYFHGGGFLSGSGDSDLYGPDYIVSHNLIVVTINYRLEVLGFLSLENEDIPGNAGLKDQVAAMRWVKENICYFGGDPDNITIFGESVGASCVTYHMFSPMCRGLFHKIIAHSGVCINEWALAENPRSRAFRLGKFLGNNTNDPKELADFLRSLPVRQLVQVTFKVMTSDEKRRGLPLFYLPIIESCYPNQESYLSERVVDLIAKGHFTNVPVILGFNNKEAVNSMKDALRKVEKINNDFERFVPREIANMVTSQKSQIFGKELQYFYFKDELFSESTLENMVELQTDSAISYNIYRFARLMADKSDKPVYFFKFCCDSKLNFMKSIMGFQNIAGAGHADDLFYLFKTKFIDEELNSNTPTGRMILQCVRLWTNFAKFGHPTPVLDDIVKIYWNPINSFSNIDYLEIGETLKPKCNPDEKRMKFWDNMYLQACYYNVITSRSRL